MKLAKKFIALTIITLFSTTIFFGIGEIGDETTSLDGDTSDTEIVIVELAIENDYEIPSIDDIAEVPEEIEELPEEILKELRILIEELLSEHDEELPEEIIEEILESLEEDLEEILSERPDLVDGGNLPNEFISEENVELIKYYIDCPECLISVARLKIKYVIQDLQGDERQAPA